MYEPRAHPTPTVAGPTELARLRAEAVQSVAPGCYATARLHWETFCEEKAISPWDDNSVDSLLLSLFQSWLAAKPSITKPGTIAKYISGIRFLFQTNRMPRAARASRCGVCTKGWPAQPMARAWCSSDRMTSRFDDIRFLYPQQRPRGSLKCDATWQRPRCSDFLAASLVFGAFGARPCRKHPYLPV